MRTLNAGPRQSAEASASWAAIAAPTAALGSANAPPPEVIPGPAKDVTTTFRESRPNDLVVLFEAGGRRLGIGRSKARRTFDIGEDERDDAGRNVGHAVLAQAPASGVSGPWNVRLRAEVDSGGKSTLHHSQFGLSCSITPVSRVYVQKGIRTGPARVKHGGKQDTMEPSSCVNFYPQVSPRLLGSRPRIIRLR